MQLSRACGITLRVVQGAVQLASTFATFADVLIRHSGKDLDVKLTSAVEVRPVPGGDHH